MNRIKNIFMLSFIFIGLFLSSCDNNNNNKQKVECTLLFYEINDGEATVSRYKGSPINVVIPSSIMIGNIEVPVTSIGEEAFNGCSSLKSIEIPNSVTSIEDYAFLRCQELTSIEMSNELTSIGNSAFFGCESLTSIEIPNSVTSIGDNAFFDCNDLEYNTYDNGKYLGNKENPYLLLIGATSTDITACEINSKTRFIHSYAFNNCESISDIEILSNLTSIGSYAFCNCLDLTSIKIPNSITSIGDCAFLYSGIESIMIPNGIVNIGRNLFDGCINLEYNTYDNGKYLGNDENPYLLLVDVTSEDITDCEINNNTRFIGSSAFEGCTSLNSIEIPSSVVEIGIKAFDDSSIGDIEIPNSVTSIGDYAFYGCRNLTSIEIPNSLTSIGTYVFSDCISLTSIEIPNSVTSIGLYAFSGCSSLTTVEIPNSVTSIEDNAFSDCSNLTSIEIPNSVTSIGSNIFEDCAKLEYNTYYNGNYLGNDENPYLILVDVTSKYIEAIKINSNTRFIGNSAFYGCSSLRSIEIPNSVISIGDNSFRNCFMLRIIEIPNSVASIESGAFVNCINLEVVYYSGTSLDWDYIEIDTYGTDYLTAIYYYSETQPTKEGNYWHYDTDGVTPVVW